MIFTIDADNNISAFATAEEGNAATTTPFETFSSQKELAQLAGAWPTERVVAIWNSLPGVKEVKGFKNAMAGAGRIWERIHGLGEAVKPAEEPKPKAAKKATGGAKAAKGAAAKGKADFVQAILQAVEHFRGRRLLIELQIIAGYWPPNGSGF